MKMKNLFVLVALVVCSLALSGCLSHWFVDSTTRLQVENQSSRTIVGIDVISEDGTRTWQWVTDTIAPGEKSRVYEEDLVGLFQIQIKTTAGAYPIDEIRFDGGSEYVIFTDDKDGFLHYEFK